MGGFYPAPNPAYYRGGNGGGHMNYGGYNPSTPSDPIAECYLGMLALPDGAKTQKVFQRWYIVEEPLSRLRQWFGLPPKYRVYELCYDLVFRREYEAPALTKGQAVKMALCLSAATSRAISMQPMLIKSGQTVSTTSSHTI